VGSDAGFDGVILHGLSTFGFAARAILKAVGGGMPSALRYFGVRFTAPVMPGDGLETSVWEVKKAPDGTTEVAFEVKNTRTGKVCLLPQGLIDENFPPTDSFLIHFRLFLVVGSRG
jgi:peroxisomal enoyl-CoA hydratase 2